MIWSLVVTLCVCLGIVVSSIVKPSVKIKKFTLNFYWVIALFGALILLAAGVLPVNEFVDGLTADSGINPIQILILFISMTVISIFLDELGFFDHAANFVICHTKAKQTSLFFSLYALVSVLTMFTSNDIIILTLTPFIIFFSKSAKISAVPFLVAEFTAANTWSMMFVIGNPTNIYLASSYNIDFISYFKVMCFPTLIAGITELLILYLIFRKKLKEPVEHKETKLNKEDIPLTVIGLVVLAVCTLFLIISSYISLPMYLIAVCSLGALVVSAFICCIVRNREPKELIRSVLRAPFELIPFVLSMFVLVLALNKYGITDWICDELGSSLAVFKYGYASLIFANLLNNIPMSVIFSSVLSGLDGNALLGGLYASIAGSNIGAFITPVGALAGIMWMNILKNHDVKYSFADFTKYGAAVGIPTITAALLVLQFIV